MAALERKLTKHGWAILPLRLAIGFGFAAHGYAKLERGPDRFAALLGSLGVPQPHAMAWVTALLEFVGGIGVIAGHLYSPLAFPWR